MHIALVQPEIPGNTGSIGRVCVGTATTLHLVGQLGFSLDEKYVRRAGLDYWKNVDLRLHVDLDALIATLPASPLHLFSAHASVRYDSVAYGPDDVLIFGCETKGLPEAIVRRFADRLLYVPTNGRIRSLNLANVATAVLFEALRQQDFGGMQPRPDPT
ncbi:MAG: tRNA (cytidine(34)-2'-O)-methyltransferase [Myxococcales bacterium]|nr:tRNA (cytidine(34)-2'-O)-methyltransferase [Myxococcales bacterium]